MVKKAAVAGVEGVAGGRASKYGGRLAVKTRRGRDHGGRRRKFLRPRTF